MGILAPTAWNFAGSERNSLISPSSSIASSQPATSVNVDFGMSLEMTLAFDFPNCMTPRPPPWAWFMKKKKIRMIRPKIRIVGSSCASTLGWGFSEVDSSMVPASTCSSTASSRRSCWPWM